MTLNYIFLFSGNNIKVQGVLKMGRIIYLLNVNFIIL